jgi:NAD(P)-dependent dehydrogenase (short-subunit alcohol dehydrogenase family)
VSSGTHDPDQWSGMPAPQLQDALSLAYPKDDAAVAGSMQKLGQRRYATSKHCNILCAYELARRLQASGQSVTVNAFDPGLMPGSGLARRLKGHTSRGSINLTAVPAERGIGSIDSEKRDSALRYPPAWQVDAVLGA